MVSDTEDTAVTEFTEKNAEQTGLSGVENRKEADILLLQIKKRKRTEKNESHETPTRVGLSTFGQPWKTDRELWRN